MCIPGWDCNAFTRGSSLMSPILPLGTLRETNPFRKAWYSGYSQAGGSLGSSICMYPYVSRMYSYVTRMYSYVSRMLLVCYPNVLVCTRMLLVCTCMYPHVSRMSPVWCISHDPSKTPSVQIINLYIKQSINQSIRSILIGQYLPQFPNLQRYFISSTPQPDVNITWQ